MKRVRKRNRNRYLSCAYINEKQVISGTVITNATLVFCARQLLVFSVSRSNSIPIVRTGHVSTNIPSFLFCGK